MDWLRRGYDTYMRVSLDPSVPPVRVTWYRAAPNAQVFRGVSCFGSTVWETDSRDYPASGLGEIDLVRRRASALVHRDDGQGPITTPLSWFVDGVPANYVPRTCCGEPLGRGIGEIAGPGVVGWFAESNNPRNVGLLELSSPGARVAGWESWVDESADPGLNALDQVGETAGPEVEHDPPRRGVGETAGPEVEHDPPRRGVGETAGPEVAWLTIAGELAGPGLNPMDFAGELVAPAIAGVMLAGELAGPGLNPMDFAGETVGPGGEYVPPRDGVGESAVGDALVPPEGEVAELVIPGGQLLCPAPSQIFNSGVDALGVKLADLVPDPHWLVTRASYAAAAWTQRHDYVFLPDAASDASSWVSDAEDWHADPDSFRYYQTTFTLSTVSGLSGCYLGGRMCVDDQTFQVRVNGVAYPINVSGPGWHGFAFPAVDLVVGSNTIKFLCLSSDSTHPTNEEGFRIEWER